MLQDDDEDEEHNLLASDGRNSGLYLNARHGINNIPPVKAT